MSKRPRVQSPGDFADAVARAAAHQTTEEADLIRLSAEDQIRFVELLLDPPPLNPAMERAREAYARLFGKPTP